MNSALLSSKNMNWCTPQDFYECLDNEFHFALDAAATDKTAKCRLYYTPETDGLAQSWDVGGAVFCNPPYGREIGKWVRKFVRRSAGGLSDCTSDSRADRHRLVSRLHIRETGNPFLRGRLRFTDEDGNAADPAPFPSMVVVYNGKRSEQWTR